MSRLCHRSYHIFRVCLSPIASVFSSFSPGISDATTTTTTHPWTTFRGFFSLSLSLFYLCRTAAAARIQKKETGTQDDPATQAPRIPPHDVKKATNLSILKAVSKKKTLIKRRRLALLPRLWLCRVPSPSATNCVKCPTASFLRASDFPVTLSVYRNANWPLSQSCSSAGRLLPSVLCVETFRGGWWALFFFYYHPSFGLYV